MADRDTWVARFAQYAGVWCRSHPEKAVALWGHLETSPQQAGGGAMTSPSAMLIPRRRRQISPLISAFTQAMVESSATLQKSVPAVQLPPARGPRGGRYRPVSHGTTAGPVPRCVAGTLTAVLGVGTQRICGLRGDMITSDAARPGVDFMHTLYCLYLFGNLSDFPSHHR